MADKKTTKSKNTTSKKKSTAKKKPSARPERRSSASETKREPIPTWIVTCFLAVAAVFIAVCFVTEGVTGIFGVGIRTFFFGLLGGGAWAVPVLVAVTAIFYRRDSERGAVRFKVIFSSIFTVLLSSMLKIWANGADTFSPGILWKDGVSLKGGGVIGGIVGGLLRKCLGVVGMNIIGITALVIFAMFVFGLTPHTISLYIRYYIHERRERSEYEREAKSRYFEAHTPEISSVEKEKPSKKKKKFDPDVEIGEDNIEEATDEDFVPFEDDSEHDDAPIIDEKVYDEIAAEDADKPFETLDENIPPFDLDENVMKQIEHLQPLVSRKITKKGEDIEGVSDGTAREEAIRSAENSGEEKIDLASIFVDPASSEALDNIKGFGTIKRDEDISDGIEADATLKIERSPASTEAPAVPEPEAPKKEYVFPPISLLSKNLSNAKNEDASEELRTNATKLVETLRSFKVRTKIVNISRGPTITRYELQPEEGIRVRAIANLVDDISLSLATTGVRIEAPIPGKAAVGIEVPNKNVNTVYLRELIETQKFKTAPSNITVSLGMDVAGEPVFCDIAKMPHLLIAGATGMGKSVCINSMIVSLLYKAKPDDVKLMLIDPKKVELNIYNGLPHLLVPVVSEPKKAAGSLHWAVTEMERRFEMIEDVGMRDLKGYNEITKDDPEKEHLPHIVIIIDELADLMMTAPDDVEESICRLAQKARAAGMHLIIGTQRPSVDVITGLIKANIPSRIAFTVASQTDSRVIIDIGGAEKLIGRGDMLYAPVGAAKPRRVQGAFVSEHEVEQVVEFIKKQGVAEYSDKIMDSIEKEAARCDRKKGSAAEFDDDPGFDSDPMLKSAIALAVDSGKISTSLIQRRLSLGYGRAAKLIDTMEQMGIVSPPEGQKPRSVLITREQYMEMVLNNSGD